MAIVREQVVQAAERYVSRGKIEAAIREYKKVLAENPNDASTLNRVGDLYARIQRIDEAVDFFSKIAEQYSAEGFFVKAIAIYKKIIKLNPTHLEVYEQLAELYHKQGLVNEARTQYLVLADYYQKHENPTSAIAIYNKMAELEPENPTYHVKLADLYQQQKLFEKAMTEHRIIAELMLAAGHAPEAAQVYERALDIDAGNIAFVTDAVLKLREAGSNAAAARFLAAAIDRNPQAERVARLLGEDLTPDEPLAVPPQARRATPSGTFRAPVSPSGRFQAPVPEPEPEPEPEIQPQPEPEADFAADFASGFQPDFGEIELDLDMGFGDGGLVQPTEPAPPPPPRPAPSRPPAAQESAAVDDEIELDLDEVFVLDIEDDEEPASLVKPPPDLAGSDTWRPAWAQPQAPSAAPAAPAGAETPAVEQRAEQRAESRDEDLDDPALRPFALDLDDDSSAEDADSSYTLDLDEEPEPEAPSAAAPLADFDFESFADVASELPPDLTADPSPAGLDFDLLVMDLPELGAPPAAEPPPPLPAGVEIDGDLLERTAAELQPQVQHREEDLVTEAEVLAKYGLEDKALERLREALRMNPRHLDAHALLIQIHLDKKRHERVVELANQMGRVAAAAGNREPWVKMRKRLAAAGYRLDGDQVVAAPQRAEVADDGVNEMLRGLLGKGSPSRKAPARPQPPPPPPPPAIEARAVEAPPPVAPPPAPVAAPPEIAPAAAAPPAAPLAAAPAPASPRPASGPFPPPAPSGEIRFNPLEIGELVEREDLGDYDAGEPADFRPAIPPELTPVPRPPAPASLDDTGMSWLDEVDAGRRKQAGGGASLSDADFFDLAGELEQELSAEESLHGEELLQPVEQSLEQIVEGFKKGVAENLSPTDYETHFNLGIAYREMGLLDEAIGEFQLAAKATSLLVSCCSMLGLCFLDKQLPELAVKWYQRGLDSGQGSEEDRLGLLYDMGNVFDSMGQTETAYRAFVEIYGINTNYRDVVARIEELGRKR